MKHYTQSIYIGKRIVEVGFRQQEFVHAELRAPMSSVWCCPMCGEVWAKALICDETEKIQPFQFLSSVCENCVDYRWRYPSGSLWLPLDDAFNASLDVVTLHRELLLHLDFYAPEWKEEPADTPQ